jgi:hypothetical protein
VPTPFLLIDVVRKRETLESIERRSRRLHVVSMLIFGRDIRMPMVRAIPDVTCGSLRVGRPPNRYLEVPAADASAIRRGSGLIATMNRALSWCGAQRWSDIEEIESAAADPSLCHPADATTRRE